VPRYMVLIKGNAQSEAGTMPNAKLAADMDAYNDELVRAGVRLAAEGLQPSSRGARVTLSANGDAKVVDGPFAEAKEAIGGFWILQCKTLDECVEWVRRAPVDALPGATGEAEIDILQLFD
jgi:hypothetical protein